MLKLDKISKIYRTNEIETRALHDVSLSIKKGEFVAMMGPSGCGKSTLLNIIGMIDNPSAGKYYFSNQEVSDYSERQRTNLRKINVGFVFQSFNLIDELNVAQNIELPLKYLGVKPSDRNKRVNEITSYLEIEHRKNHFPHQLSGGQQQRVAIARAVIANPKIILADEPTGNLDSKNGEEVMKLLTDLNNQGTTIVMVTHSPAHAKYSHRVIHLLDGKVISEKTHRDYEMKKNHFF